MRKVTFYINDNEYFYKELTEKEGVSSEKAKEIISGLNNFVATYSIIGNGTTADRYELYNAEGAAININDVNNYEKGVILNSCMAYFEGRKDDHGEDYPQGVIEIKETII